NAALTWRLPPRFRRWRVSSEEQTGMGAVPFQRANAVVERNLAAPAISPTISAAERSPQPGTSNRARTLPPTIRPILCSGSVARGSTLGTAPPTPERDPQRCPTSRAGVHAQDRRDGTGRDHAGLSAIEIQPIRFNHEAAVRTCGQPIGAQT